jgi:hypothetical protein
VISWQLIEMNLACWINDFVCFKMMLCTTFAFPTHLSMSNFSLGYGKPSRSQINLSHAQDWSQACHILANGKLPQIEYFSLFFYLPSIDHHFHNRIWTLTSMNPFILLMLAIIVDIPSLKFPNNQLQLSTCLHVFENNPT